MIQMLQLPIDHKRGQYGRSAKLAAREFRSDEFQVLREEWLVTQAFSDQE
jgi:hypothetical protein